MSHEILEGFEREATLAKALNMSRRTLARYRRQGMPWMDWGGEIWINVAGAKHWIAKRVQSNGTR